jgi:pSer/pThr/pTyr-binding forkhead associated (FHA) protein
MEFADLDGGDSQGVSDSTQRFSDDLLAADEHGLNSEERSAIEALPSGSALLIVQRGPNQGSRFLLDQDVTTVGRHPNADIFLDDVTVSRRHSEFRRHASKFMIHDLASLNGTYFDGVRIDSALLDDGAEVQIGKFKLTFFASRSDLGE